MTLIARTKSDYEKLYDSYDNRYEQNRMSDTLKFLDKEITQNKFNRILEVGCGTGYWVKNLVSGERFVTGLDLSLPMLLQARRKIKHGHLINGEASTLPFDTQTFDFVFCVNAVHHFENKERFFVEAFKVLKTKGEIAIVLADIFNPDYKWYVYDYFDRAFEIDAARIPSIGELKEMMSKAGFSNLRTVTTEVIKDKRKGTNVLSDHFLQKKGNSTLFALSDEEYSVGLEKIREEASNPDAAFLTNVIFKAVIGNKEGS